MTSPSETTHQRSIVANSGPGFARQLVKNIDPVGAPKLQLTAWNVGGRTLDSVINPSNTVTDLLSQQKMTLLAEAYFEKVDPCYHFIDRSRTFIDIERRWSEQCSRSLDAMLCGLAALGSFFSKVQAVAVEGQLVKLAKSILDDIDGAVDIYSLTAAVLRVVYLRVAGEPLTAWSTSCATMHQLQAAGICASQSQRNLLGFPSLDCPPQTKRRLFGVTQHLNTWISFDVGLSRVSLQPPDIPAEPDSPSHYSEKLLQLLPASVSLDPAETQNEDTLTSALQILLAKRDTQGPLVMAQCNLLLCILRRLTNLKQGEDSLVTPSLRFMSKSLACAHEMIRDDQPWHHLANMPFQIFCMLLAIDTPASLRMVDDAVQTLLAVVRAYDRPSLRDAANTAYLILSLHRKRRREDADIMDKILAKPMDLKAPQDHVDGWPVPSEAEVAWIHSLMSEFPTLQDMDVSNMMDAFIDTGDP